jgi:lipopolysaccharide heptosyltransferase II
MLDNLHNTRNYELETVQNILLISLTGIGNTIFFTPVVRNVRDIFKEAKIVFLGSPLTIPVVSDCPYLDEILCYDIDHKSKLLEQIRLIKRLRKRKIDAVICAFSERSTYKFSLLSWFTGAKIRAGVNEKGRGIFLTHQIEPVTGRHEVDQNLDILRTLTPHTLSNEMFFWIGETDKEFARQWLTEMKIDKSQLIIGLHPGSSPENPHKRWPVENYSRLCNWLHEKHQANMIIFGGPDEENLAASVAGNIPSAKVAAGLATLKQTAAILDCCNLFIGHDSGVMHIAAALGIPVVAMFGPTSSRIYGPYGTNHRIIVSEEFGKNSMGKIDVDKAQQNIERLLKKIDMR